MTESTPPSAPAAPAHGTLARRMGLFTLIVYGVGDMVGSGIYGTIGKAAGSLGNAVWMAFVGSMIAAMFTGLSYASLASRHPKAAGAAFITQHAYRWGFFAYIVGLAVAASGLTSMATNSNVFASTLEAFVAPVPGLGAIPGWVYVVLFVGAMTGLNIWGIRESMWANVVCTAIEVGGLLFVIAVGMSYWGDVNYLQAPVAAAADGAGEATAGGSGLSLMLLSSGAVLTFFAFVGFEDMLNVAEEVKNPERNMPWGIVIALVITTILYLLTSITAVSVVDYRELADSSLGAPLAQVTDKAAPWLPQWVFEGITLFAAMNTVLINFVMASRLLYGMSRQKLLPGPLGRVHPKRQTPHVAILTLMVMVLLLSFAASINSTLADSVKSLASATSLLLLMVFCVINAALVILKYRPGEPRGQFEVPVIVPILGILACGGLVATRLIAAVQDWEANGTAPTIALGMVIFIAIIYAAVRPKAITEEALAEAEGEHT